jgi:hypothetical protein
MGGEGTAGSMATCRFAKAGTFNGFLHCLLDHAWIQVVTTFFALGGVFPADLPSSRRPEWSRIDG